MHGRIVVAVWMLLLTGCGGAEWVHPTKSTDEFAQEYNRCQGEILRDPKYQQGNNYFLLRGTEQCVMKKGWVLRDKTQ